MVSLMRQCEGHDEAKRDILRKESVNELNGESRCMLDAELSIDTLEKQLFSLCAAITSCGASPHPHF